VTYDNWTVKQKPNCEIFPLTANTLTDKVYDYDESATSTLVYTSTEAFANSKPTDCPVLSCTLKKSGCLISRHPDSPFSLDPAFPFGIKVRQNLASGYPLVYFCYSCTNYKHTVSKEIGIR
jgi:hypothetical protein